MVHNLFEKIESMGYEFFTGVPDSALKQFQDSILNSDYEHIVAANEGQAIGIAVGAELAGKKSCVYLQNSGLGNAINPLISITNKNVYSIPSILIIGWRGSPNSKDEPQHQAMGKITKEILK